MRQEVGITFALLKICRKELRTMYNEVDWDDEWTREDDYTPELPEYMEAIQSAVDAEVERRVSEAVKDLDMLREEQKKYNEDRARWDEIVQKIDKRRQEAERKMEKMEDEKNAAINDAKAKKIEELFEGWKKGDTAYVVEYSTVYPQCPVCEGHLNVFLPVVGVGKSVKVDCPYCRRGQKWGFPQYKLAEVKSFNIQNPLVSMNEKTGKVYPAAYCNNYDFRGIKDLTGAFHSEKEAEAFAEQHNKAALAECKVKLMEDVHKKGFDQLLPENRKKEEEA